MIRRAVRFLGDVMMGSMLLAGVAILALFIDHDSMVDPVGLNDQH